MDSKREYIDALSQLYKFADQKRGETEPSKLRENILTDMKIRKLTKRYEMKLYEILHSQYGK